MADPAKDRAEKAQKLTNLIGALMRQDADKEMLFGALKANGLAALRHLDGMQFTADPERREAARRGIIMDTETTGFVSAIEGEAAAVEYSPDGVDHVTQLSMLEIFYDDEGIVGTGEFFDRYRDPGFPIPEEVVALTGITDDMVRGKEISDEEIAAFLEDAEMMTAHNAPFDRKFVERQFKDAGFDKIDWHCSVEQVDWKARGYGSAKLEMLAFQQGFVYPAHNARADVLALGHVLSAPGENGSAFSEMLERGRVGQVLICAERSPFEKKDVLKRAGWRWSPDGVAAGGIKCWHKTIDNTPEARADAADLLRQVYGREIALPAKELDGKLRYSSRQGRADDRFRTQDAPTLADVAKMELQDERQTMLF
jgi:DNA polymerase-3 subunit epsilon